MKNRLNSIALYALIAFGITSCTKDEILPKEEVIPLVEKGEITANLGGANLPNQVYVDLSTGKTTSVKRNSWDLAFYAGDEFRVLLNSSMYMSAGKITATDINTVTSTNEEVKRLQNTIPVEAMFGNGTYVDPITGAFTETSPDFGTASETAIAEISETDSKNNVYLVNLGDKIGTDTPETGSVSTFGDSRGWKKIKILRRNNSYVLQYADLNDTTHKEVTIEKNSDYNFSFFSLISEKEVTVQPKKNEWDLCFTTATSAGFAGSVRLWEFALTNRWSEVKSYQLDGLETSYNYSGFNYENFLLENVAEENFKESISTIGKNWYKDPFNSIKEGTENNIRKDLFYIVKDTEKNIYKIEFTAIINEAGERGAPIFKYELLQ